MSSGLCDYSGLAPSTAGFDSPAAGALDFDSTDFGSGAIIWVGPDSEDFGPIDFGSLAAAEPWRPPGLAPAFFSVLVLSSPLAVRLEARPGAAGPLATDLR